MAQDVIIQGYGTPGSAAFAIRQGYTASVLDSAPNVVVEGMGSLFYMTQGYQFGSQVFFPVTGGHMVVGAGFGGMSRS